MRLRLDQKATQRPLANIRKVFPFILSGAQGEAPRRHATIRGRLLTLVSCVAIPILLLTGAGIWEFYAANRTAAEQRLIGHARSMALLLDREFAGAEQTLKSLGASRTLLRGDLDGFQLEMNAAAIATGASAINLSTPEGNVFRSTVWPPGQHSPVKAVTLGREALPSGQALINNLYDSPTTQRPAVSVLIPFDLQTNPGPTRFVLGLVLPRERLLSALTDQRLPAGTHATIVDRNKVIVARTLRDPETVGKPVGEAAAGVMASGEMTSGAGLAHYTSWEGQPTVSAYVRAPRSQFWVGIGVPEAEFLAPLNTALQRIVLFGTILLGAALVMALLLARQFAASLRFLAPGTGAAPPDGVGGRRGFVEVDNLARALAEASAERDAALAEMRLLWATSPVGMAYSSFDGGVQGANDAFLRIIGATRGDLEAGRIRWNSITPPEWVSRDETAVKQAFATGSCQPYEKEYLRPDGDRVAVLVVFGLLDRSSGRCVAFVVDLTDRKRSEAALAASEERLLQAQEAGGIGLWDLDYDNSVARITPTCQALHGLPFEAAGTITYQAWLALVHHEDRLRVEAETQSAIETDGVLDCEFRIRRADTGRVRWLHARARSLSASGTKRLVGTAQDITQRKEAEIAAANSDFTLRSVLASTTDCVKVLDAEGRILYINEAGARRARIEDAAALIGKPWHELWDWEHTQTVREAHAQALNGTEARFFGLMRTPEGGPAWWDVAVSPVPGGVGRPDRVLAISRDVTVSRLPAEEVRALAASLQPILAERTEALLATEKELLAEVQRREEAQTALLQAQKLEALGQLTSGVAHDFNNMLAAIQGCFTLLGRRVHDESGVRLLQNGKRASERAAALIRQLLAFSRREEPKPTVLKPSDVLKGVGELVHHAVGPKVSLVLEPVPDGTWNIIADLNQFEVALLNLAVNARDAMPDGGTLTFSARNYTGGADVDLPGLPAGDCVLFDVRDTGTGMPPDVMARAKEPFFTTKEKGKGTGLGLAMVFGMAEQLGGTMHIRSAPGAGTTMTIALPRAEALALGLGVAEPAIDRAVHGAATILVVDDDEPVRGVTSGFLRDLGYTVIEAGNAEAALALAHASGSVDLVMTDVEMPGADGRLLASRLRLEWPGQPIIFMTGYAGAAELNGQAILTKPFNFAELADRVAEQLGRTDAGKEHNRAGHSK